MRAGQQAVPGESPHPPGHRAGQGHSGRPHPALHGAPSPTVGALCLPRGHTHLGPGLSCLSLHLERLARGAPAQRSFTKGYLEEEEEDRVNSVFWMEGESYKQVLPLPQFPPGRERQEGPADA